MSDTAHNDLQALKREGAEESEETTAPEAVSFEFDGVTYSIDADALDDVELLELIEEEKHILVLRGYLGREQWEEFKDSHRNDRGRVGSEPVKRLMAAVMGATGQGN